MTHPESCQLQHRYCSIVSMVTMATGTWRENDRNPSSSRLSHESGRRLRSPGRLSRESSTSHTRDRSTNSRSSGRSNQEPSRTFTFSPPLSELESPLAPSSSLRCDFSRITDMEYDDWCATVRNLSRYIPPRLEDYWLSYQGSTSSIVHSCHCAIYKNVPTLSTSSG